jgi:microcystin-dependent protein
MPTYNEVANLILTNLDDAVPGGITAAAHRSVENALLNFAKEIAEAQWLKGDIKEVDCTQQYIADNFESNGLGKNERLGWAICNGFQGLTKNRTGRVSVGYGVNGADTNGVSIAQTNIGATIAAPVIGGEKNHTLVVTEMPRHRHDSLLFSEGGVGNFAGGQGGTAGGDGTGLTRYTGGAGSGETNNLTTGTAVPHNNMQPYIVTLFIQKL